MPATNVPIKAQEIVQQMAHHARNVQARLVRASDGQRRDNIDHDADGCHDDHCRTPNVLGVNEAKNCFGRDDN